MFANVVAGAKAEIIDLVARRASLVVFCEVNPAPGSRVRAPGRGRHRSRSAQRLRLLARLWLTAHPVQAADLRFDVAVRAPERRQVGGRSTCWESRVLVSGGSSAPAPARAGVGARTANSPCASAAVHLRRAAAPHDLVPLAGTDLVVAARAAVGLRRLVRLDMAYVFTMVWASSVGVRPIVFGHWCSVMGKAAQATSSATITSATTTTIAQVAAPSRFCPPNGLKPTPPR